MRKEILSEALKSFLIEAYDVTSLLRNAKGNDHYGITFKGNTLNSKFYNINAPLDPHKMPAHPLHTFSSADEILQMVASLKPAQISYKEMGRNDKKGTLAKYLKTSWDKSTIKDYDVCFKNITADIAAHNYDKETEQSILKLLHRTFCIYLQCDNACYSIVIQAENPKKWYLSMVSALVYPKEAAEEFNEATWKALFKAYLKDDNFNDYFSGFRLSNSLK